MTAPEPPPTALPLPGGRGAARLLGACGVSWQRVIGVEIALLERRVPFVDVASSLGNLASLYVSRGEYGRAEPIPMYRRPRTRTNVPAVRAVRRASRSHRILKEPLVTARINWDLPLSAFDGMAFDDRGRLHVITTGLGVLRRDDDHWTRLTPEWPLLRGPEDSTPNNLSGLVVRRSLLVIATWGMGVVVWDVDTGKVRRIPFAP